MALWNSRAINVSALAGAAGSFTTTFEDTLQLMTLDELSAWCAGTLGAAIDRVLFETGFSSRVYGVLLLDGREVVLKVGPFSPRLFGTAEVHWRLSVAGFPCPEPLAGPSELGDWWVSAERLVTGGSVLVADPESPELYALALADLRPSPLRVLSRNSSGETRTNVWNAHPAPMASARLRGHAASAIT